MAHTGQKSGNSHILGWYDNSTTYSRAGLKTHTYLTASDKEKPEASNFDDQNLLLFLIKNVSQLTRGPSDHIMLFQGQLISAVSCWLSPLQVNAYLPLIMHAWTHWVASVMSNSLKSYGPWPIRFLCSWGSPGKITGVGCHVFLQGIFWTQGSNLGPS